MSSVAEGWYLDPSTGTNLRFWSGSTWTDEVAPLPPEAPDLGLFVEKVEPVKAAETVETVEPAAEEASLEVEPAVEEASLEVEPAVAEVPLEDDLEHTQLTRRELRARRGSDPDLNDAPKHLPLIAPPPVVAAAPAEPPEDLELEIPPMEAVEQEEPPPPAEEEKDPARRHRILRMTVLLSILAVVSSVGVLTAGSL